MTAVSPAPMTPALTPPAQRCAGAQTALTLRLPVDDGALAAHERVALTLRSKG